MTTTPLSRAPPLLPTGTARALFLGAATPDVDEALSSADLRERLRARDVSDDTWLAAWEVTRWATSAPTLDRRALGCLVIALLEAIESGSTCLPIGVAFADTNPGADAGESTGSSAGTGGGLAGRTDVLSPLLLRLNLSDSERQATHALAARIADGTALPPIADLFGPPGVRRPFVLSDGALYTERLWSVEDRLAMALRARLGGTVSPFSGSIDDALTAVMALDGTPRLADEQVAPPCARRSPTR